MATSSDYSFTGILCKLLIEFISRGNGLDNGDRKILLQLRLVNKEFYYLILKTSMWQSLKFGFAMNFFILSDYNCSVYIRTNAWNSLRIPTISLNFYIQFDGDDTTLEKKAENTVIIYGNYFLQDKYLIIDNNKTFYATLSYMEKTRWKTQLKNEKFLKIKKKIEKRRKETRNRINENIVTDLETCFNYIYPLNIVHVSLIGR